MLRPSKVAVPRPISSSTTSDRGVAVCRMFAVSCISTINVEWPRAMLSDAPTRAKIRSTSDAGEDVEPGRRGGRVLYAGRFGCARPPQSLEDIELALEDPLVGAEHLLFVVLQRRRDEALPARDRLLPMVISRHRVQVRL